MIEKETKIPTAQFHFHWVYIADEVFYSLGFIETNKKPFDQNRLYVGLLIPLNNTITLDLSYINQYQPLQGLDQLDHILWLRFNVQLHRNSV